MKNSYIVHIAEMPDLELSELVIWCTFYCKNDWGIFANDFVDEGGYLISFEDKNDRLLFCLSNDYMNKTS